MDHQLTRFIRSRAFVFVLVFAWKIALFLISTQPVPANDSFFYDGAVVNLLLHGKYVNPSLALALPISGARLFCAYPPLYQAVLLPWMVLCGTSVQSAMVFHLVWFGIYLVVLFAIFRELDAPVWCFRLAGLFLFGITFHDRPDSVAQALGMIAVLCWARSMGCCHPVQPGPARPAWVWAAGGWIVLVFATSLQIGAIYLLLIWAGALAAWWMAREKLQLAPLFVMSAIPPLAIALVARVYPHLWTGFLEHAHQTPSFTGLRLPALEDLLKVGRTAPGIFGGGVLIVWSWLNGTGRGIGSTARFVPVECAFLIASMAVVMASLFVLTPNMVNAVTYLQPVVVGCCLARFGGTGDGLRRLRPAFAVLVCLALLTSIRAIGMTTWGIACAHDVSCTAALRRIDTELNGVRPGQTVVLSSAYLYEAARRGDLRWIHSDWLGPAKTGNPNADRDALLAVKPTRLILTQFDYYRRYKSVLASLKTQMPSVEFEVSNLARVPAPDSLPSFRRVVQHISWAPVIVRFHWAQD